MEHVTNHRITRSEEITRLYFEVLDRHLEDLIQGKTIEMMRLHEIASVLCVSHKHLTDTVKSVMGHHPCYFYDQKIIEKAKTLLEETDLPIAKIALMLTYDPSNFSKFFKKFTGERPMRWRLNALR